MTTIAKQIRAAGFTKLLGGALSALAQAVITGMTGNTAYSTLPVDLTVLKTGMDSYNASLAAALDGGKMALQNRDVQRAALLRILSELARYVELNCKDDLTVFMSSGFPAASTSSTAPQPLPPASIVRIDAGVMSGQLQVVVKPLNKARSYDLRFAPVPAGGSPGPGTTLSFATARKAPPVTGLTPGATYMFQVRALGSLGYTDWSDPLTRVCT